MKNVLAVTGAGSSAEHLPVVGESYAEFASLYPTLFRLMFGRKGRFATHERFRDAASAAVRVLVGSVAAVMDVAPHSPDAVTTPIAAWSLVNRDAALRVGRQLDDRLVLGWSTAREVVDVLLISMHCPARTGGAGRPPGELDSRRIRIRFLPYAVERHA